jgi:hypothetical protein
MKRLLIMIGFAVWGTALPYTWNVTNFTNAPYTVEIYEVGRVAGSANPKMSVPSSTTVPINTGGYLANGYCVFNVGGKRIFNKYWSKGLGRGGENLVIVKDASGKVHVIRGDVEVSLTEGIEVKE